jgi:hypothetical protein
MAKREERRCKACGRAFTPRSERGGKRDYCYEPACERERERTKYSRAKATRVQQQRTELEVCEACRCLLELDRLRDMLARKQAWTIPVSKLFIEALRRAYSAGAKDAIAGAEKIISEVK